MWYVCDLLYAVLYISVNCFVVRGCAVSRRYINVYNCDVFGVVNICLVLCVLMVEIMSVVLNVMLFPMSVKSTTPGLYNLSLRPVCEVMFFVSFCFRGELGFRNSDDICMCVVN